jgi:hypothetical protein
LQLLQYPREFNGDKLKNAGCKNVEVSGTEKGISERQN